MSNRVIVGNRSGTYGIFVSRPGVDVVSASDANLLMGSHLKNLQVMASGSFSSSSGTTSISWPAFGFRPRILIQSQNYTSLVYTSDNSANITIFSLQSQLAAQWNLSGVPTLSSAVYWSAISTGV